MVRRWFALALMLVVAPLFAACHGPVPRPATASAADFHHSDPATVGTTGHPQLLEFFGPT
jgi:hypothetical protein